MTEILATYSPLAAAGLSFCVGLFLLFYRQKSTLLKAVLISTPALLLLQTGTWIIVTGHTGIEQLTGGRIVIVAFCMLAPISTAIALLWGYWDGREILRRHTMVLALQILISMLFIAMLLIDDSLLVVQTSLLKGGLQYGKYGWAFLIYLIVTSVFILSVFERKLRIFRNQSKFRAPTIIFMGIFVFFVIGASQGLLVRTLNPGMLVLVSLCIILAYIFPLIFRVRQFSILDRILDRRETVYSSFMILIAGVYLIVIGLVGKLISVMGGDIQAFFSVIAALAVIAIFLVLLTSLSIRARLRKFIDKTIYRGRYDYRSIWSRFSDDTSFIMETDQLVESILDTVTDILNVRQGAVLLSDATGTHLQIVKKKGTQAAEECTLPLHHEFIDWLWRLGEPLALDGSTGTAPPEAFAGLRQQFEQLATAVCVPLISKTGLIGLIVLGNKKSGAYTQEDFELLETLANQSAVTIQGLTLQDELRQSKELESYYKLTSFVIHDLRNVVSILSMLSENARNNMDDPEFLHSLLDTLSVSVDKMRNMLSKVSIASRQIEVAPEEFDPLAMVEEALADIHLSGNVELEIQRSEVPPVVSDVRQLKKVLVNLVLNAREAMPGGGRIVVRIADRPCSELPHAYRVSMEEDECLLLSVSDNGTGMSETFLRTRLFRPFQSTKHKGLGIGLYHCREIIETLGGKIWAESREGAGSTFYVALPLETEKEMVA